jgi:DNA-binding NtrC family response regulator
MLARHPVDLLLTDVRMPGMGGVALFRLIKERMPGTSVVLMSAYDDLPTVAGAMRDGAADFLAKPLDLHQLRGMVTRILADRRARRTPDEQAVALHTGPALVGRDHGMLAIYKLIGQASASRTTVVIRGESGTGKELIARAIHTNSADLGQPFVAVNCTALPNGLLESELFGHVRGAFTGALSQRRGRFALAEHGTIFLDEIGDTTLEFQSKLLRVLQEHEYYPVGAERPQSTDARVIAATHRDLEAMVAAGTFREDLYYRLRVVDIHVPPLRDRMSDLLVLTSHLICRAADTLKRPAPILAEDAMEALRGYAWPGNVRELENCLTRAVVLASGGVIHVEHLAIAAPASDPVATVASLTAVEREQIARALAATDGNKVRAAQILGVSRPRLDRLLRKHVLA